MGICFVMTPVQYKVGWFFFLFFRLFLYLFKKQNIYYNKNTLSEPVKVIVYIRIASRSAFKRSAHKDAACKTEAFSHTLFLENEAQNGPKKLRNHAFHVKNKSVCQKLARSCKKWKSAQKPIYALFASRPSILLLKLWI